jgi:hypothetical protein
VKTTRPPTETPDPAPPPAGADVLDHLLLRLARSRGSRVAAWAQKLLDHGAGAAGTHEAPKRRPDGPGDHPD